MKLISKQLSDLKKLLTEKNLDSNELTHKTLLGGESFSYQIGFWCDNDVPVSVEIDSTLSEYIRAYAVKKVVMDFPAYADPKSFDSDYLTYDAGIMPDLLVPLSDTGNELRASRGAEALWLTVDLPKDFAPGKYSITVRGAAINIYSGDRADCEKTMELEVLGVNLPEQSILFTQWFHTDCIASAHNVDVYSDEHWALIEKYMEAASYLGINTILTPVITPPLDTAPGTERPNVQLVRIEKNGDSYTFDFALLKKWIDLSRKHNINHFEISHLFSQWGLEYSPNIYAYINGKQEKIFGWHIKSTDESYKSFLTQFVPALVSFLKSEGIADNCVFHLSDEPNETHLDAYKYAYELVVPMLEGIPTMDALSNAEFFDKGYVNIPVTATDHIEPFLERNVENQWVYYCCGQNKKVGNRFLAMPSYRNRILGVQLYMYGIKGFLQWGFNFYYSQLSRFKINPYLTTSGEKAFPSGDPFSVYPGTDGPLLSLRAVIFKEALQDVERFKLLESLVGREKVFSVIKEFAKQDITFSEYPKSDDFLILLDEKISEMIRKSI